MEPFDRITQRPDVMGGKACIRGMRVTVGMVVGQVGAGRSIDAVLADYPYLERQDIFQALRYAAWRADEREVVLSEAWNRMRLLVDMNLSPLWVALFNGVGIEAVHWSSVGAANATDPTIMDYAAEHDYVVLTHDLDFGAILAATNGQGPSVVQIRAGDVSPTAIGRQVIAALRQMSGELQQGALLTVDTGRTRLRLLPLQTVGWALLQGPFNRRSVVATGPQIAAIALVNDLTLVTRDTPDFAGTGVRWEDPFLW